MITIEHAPERDEITIRASGTLTIKDYRTAIPEIEHAMELAEGPLDVMLRLEDFQGWALGQGWEIGALWNELTFHFRHRGAFRRIAVVGESRVEDWGTSLWAPFAEAEVRFFMTGQDDEAETWLAGGRGDSHDVA